MARSAAALEMTMGEGDPIAFGPRTRAGWRPVIIAPHLVERWSARSAAAKLGTSTAYQRRLQTFLPLVELTPAARLRGFYLLARERGWKETTLAGKYTMLLSCMKMLDIAPLHAEVRLNRVLQADAREAKVAFPVALTARHCERAARRLHRRGHTGLALLLRLAFMLGQRPSDLAPTRPGWMKLVGPGTGMIPGRFLCIPVRLGKTVRKLAPYTLHLPAELPLAHELWRLGRSRRDGRLFGATPHHEIGRVLRELNPEYSLLSVRRGGLQNLASAGVPL